MKIFYYLILFLSMVFAQSNSSKYSFNPFENKVPVKYSLNDFSNYPIGIFKFDKKIFQYDVSFYDSSKNITRVKKIFNSSISIPYVSAFDNYIE